MSALFDAAPPRLRRSPAGLTLSVVLHVGIVGGALVLSALTSGTLASRVQSRTLMVFSQPLPVPDVPIEEPRAPRSIETLPDLEPPPRVEAPPSPVREIPRARIEPVALEPMPIRTE